MVNYCKSCLFFFSSIVLYFDILSFVFRGDLCFFFVLWGWCINDDNFIDVYILYSFYLGVGLEVFVIMIFGINRGEGVIVEVEFVVDILIFFIVKGIFIVDV